MMKFILLFILILSSVQPSLAAPRTAYNCNQPILYLENRPPESRLWQTIDIPEGLLLLLLFLISVCGGALLVGVLVIVFFLKRSKKSKPPAAPQHFVNSPSSIPPTVTPPQPYSALQCSNCGATVTAQAKFCNRCGSPIAAAQISPPQKQNHSHPPSQGPPVAQNSQPAVQPDRAVNATLSEPVIGIVAGIAHQKGFSSKQFNLIVTPQRLVFARLTDQMLRDAMNQAKQEAKAEGRGFLKQWGSIFKTNAKLCERYYQMPVDMIIRENPDNFVIYSQQIRSVRIRIADAFDETNNNIDRLVIQAGSKMTFLLKGTNAREAKQILRQVLGNNVK